MVIIVISVLLENPRIFAAVVAFSLAFGACVGSFLNVVIYRLPRDISVGKPKRSFCPSCQYQIPWYYNIPLVSWLQLGGKCKNCGAKISARYWGVELLTALLYLGIALKYWHQWPVMLAFWVLISLFVAAAFIDAEHQIIPDEITIGGAVAGLVACALVPKLMILPEFYKAINWWQGLMWSAIGAAAGFFLLWSIVLLGKLAFGKKKVDFSTEDGPVAWSITQEGEDENPMIAFGDESVPWDEILYRASDRLVVECAALQINGEDLGAGQCTIQGETIRFEGRSWDLGDVKEIRGTAEKATIPREAMGFGDVKFMALVGAFLGWKAVLFTVLAASVLGAAVALASRVTGREEWGSKIPFGPWLALGATIWIFYGPEFLDWYFGLVGRSGGL